MLSFITRWTILKIDVIYERTDSTSLFITNIMAVMYHHKCAGTVSKKRNRISTIIDWLLHNYNVPISSFTKCQYPWEDTATFILGIFYVCNPIFFKRQIQVIIFLLKMKQNGFLNSKIQEILYFFQTAILLRGGYVGIL